MRRTHESCSSITTPRSVRHCSHVWFQPWVPFAVGPHSEGGSRRQAPETLAKKKYRETQEKKQRLGRTCRTHRGCATCRRCTRPAGSALAISDDVGMLSEVICSNNSYAAKNLRRSFRRSSSSPQAGAVGRGHMAHGERGAIVGRYLGAGRSMSASPTACLACVYRCADSRLECLPMMRPTRRQHRVPMAC